MDEELLTCPACGRSGPPGKRFCGDCGAALPAACPACDGLNPPGKRFCGDCGAALPGRPPAALAPSAPPGETPRPRPVQLPGTNPPAARVAALERRLATILFADLVDSTALGETLDPEALHDVLTPYLTLLSQTVEQYGGYVVKYTGDGLLALFGAPVAHDDDAERAVLAGLRMQGALASRGTASAVPPLALRMRVGITTGEVVAGPMGHSYDVSGDAANTAARLQGLAAVGGVLVDAPTQRLARRRIAFGPRQDVALKGKTGLVATYAVLGLQPTLLERWEGEGGRTPLVGREADLERVLRAWRRAQEGTGQLVTVIGEAGVGKSRLLAEALERMATGPVRVVRGRCLSYGQELSLWLVADVLRSLCGLGERDALDQVGSRVAASVDALLVGEDAETRAEAVDVLGEALGRPIGASRVTQAGAQARRVALTRSLSLLLGALGSMGTDGSAALVLALEDLHWSDAESLEVLVPALSAAPGLRVLALATQRPGWEAPWNGWGWAEHLLVQPLDSRETTRVAQAVLDGRLLSPELTRQVAERAEGNPFFVEELLRALQEAGQLEERDGVVGLAPGAGGRLPDTLSEVLLARLDQLEAEARGLAQVASVIGRSFAVRLLERMVDQDARQLEPPLAALHHAEIVFPRAHGEREYVFKHATLREVAYQTLLQRRRQALHLAAARAIATLYPRAEYVEMIAYHYRQTEEQAEAAAWLERAGERAAGMYANAAAADYYAEARRRYERSGADAGRLAVVDAHWGRVLRQAARYAEALVVLERAVATFEAQEEWSALASALAQMGEVYWASGRPRECLARLEPWLARLDAEGLTAGLAALYAAVALSLFVTGQYAALARAADRAIEVARAVGDDWTLAEGIFCHALGLYFLDREDEALPAYEEAIRLAEAVGHLDILWRALNNMAVVYQLRGALGTAKGYCERALRVTEQQGNPEWIAAIVSQLGELTHMVGDWPHARTHLERALALCREATESLPLTLALVYLGRYFVQVGLGDVAAPYLEEALARAERADDSQMLSASYQAVAEWDLLAGQPAAALRRLRAVLDRLGGDDPNTLALLPLLARAHLAVDDVTQAATIIDTVERRVRTTPKQEILVEALRVQAMVALRQNHDDTARAILEEGLALSRAMPYPYAEGHLLQIYGELSVQQGETEMGRERLAAALVIFRGLGARVDSERVENMLAAP